MIVRKFKNDFLSQSARERHRELWSSDVISATNTRHLSAMRAGYQSIPYRCTEAHELDDRSRIYSHVRHHDNGFVIHIPSNVALVHNSFYWKKNKIKGQINLSMFWRIMLLHPTFTWVFVVSIAIFSIRPLTPSKCITHVQSVIPRQGCSNNDYSSLSA